MELVTMDPIRFDLISTDRIILPLFEEKNISVSVLRLDKMHAFISGNKWFKLKYYIEKAQREKKKTLLTFGGAWSNHLLATAAACKLYDLKAIAMVRGEKPRQAGPVLEQLISMGMELYHISREEYREKKIPGFLNSDEHLVIPEGGAGIQGMEGASTIASFINKDSYTHICCAAGTGTTAAGLMHSVQSGTHIIALSVLKNHGELENNIRSLSGRDMGHLDVIHAYSFGGYARCTDSLLEFMNDFYRQTSIPSDFVYTGKLFYGIFDMIRENYFPPASKVLLIHSGGLSGNASLPPGTLLFRDS